MSLKMMAASSSPLYLRVGCSVISAAKGGLLQISKKPCFFRRARNSGRYLPAWRMTHTGERGRSGWQVAASRRSVFCMAGKLDGT